MKLTGKLVYLIRKYPLFRLFCALCVIGLILGTIFLISYRTKPIPVISSIEPPVGSPGDVVIINGKNFGKTREMSYVEISGAKLTSSSYIAWSDDCIKIVLPANVQDGLVFVGNRNLKSKPALFANEIDIPVPVSYVQQITKPVIESLSSDKVNVGQLLVIQGNNFGDSKNESRVLFTIDYSGKIAESEIKSLDLLTENMIAASENDFDYVSWSNTEIQVYVPDGACSGVVIVDTGKEKSEPKNITINTNVGRKTFSNKKIYIVQYTADIADVVTSNVSTITLRCPIPFETPSQPNVEITEISPSPILQNYQNMIIHQITKTRNNTPKSVFKQTFVLPVYEVKTEINAEKAGDFKKTNLSLLAVSSREDSLVPAENDDIKKLANQIIGRERNAYKKARLIYDYMFENFKISDKVRTYEANPLDLLKRKSGDAYDFAVIYTALLRAAEVPALTDSGVLVSQDLSTQVHWWCEFYVDGFGWVPVDIALGFGLSYKQWTDTVVENAKEYYFGNLDAHHVIFSRGFNNLKSIGADNKIVYIPRSYSLQSIWEEASDGTTKYSSYWSVPVIKGVY